MLHICTPMSHPPITYEYYKHNSIEFWSINIAKRQEIITINMAFSIPHLTNCRISSISCQPPAGPCVSGPSPPESPEGPARHILRPSAFACLWTGNHPIWQDITSLMYVIVMLFAQSLLLQTKKTSWWGAKLAFTELRGVLIWKNIKQIQMAWVTQSN